EAPAAQEEQFRIHPVKALIPVLPLVLLFLTAPPLRLIPVWPGWLVEGGGAGPLASAEQGLFDSRLVGAAMLIGAVVAACGARRGAPSRRLPPSPSCARR